MGWIMVERTANVLKFPSKPFFFFSRLIRFIWCCENSVLQPIKILVCCSWCKSIWLVQWRHSFNSKREVKLSEQRERARVEAFRGNLLFYPIDRYMVFSFASRTFCPFSVRLLGGCINVDMEWWRVAKFMSRFIFIYIMDISRFITEECNDSGQSIRVAFHEFNIPVRQFSGPKRFHIAFWLLSKVQR